MSDNNRYEINKIGFVLKIVAILLIFIPHTLKAEQVDTIAERTVMLSPADSGNVAIKPLPVSPYAMPYSLTGNTYDWHRLWINTATLSGAYVGTLLVLECLPEDATSWNRAEQ